jgi:hypothetical protein
MLIAPSALRRRRLCFPAAALAVLENFGPTMLRYFLRQRVLRPIWLSSRLQVEHGAPVKDLVSAWVFSRPLLTRQVSFQMMQ